MQRYDFDRFLEKMAALDYFKLLKEAEHEAELVDDSTRKVSGAAKNRADGAVEYVIKIGAFLYFMKHFQRPSNTPDEDFKKYRKVVEVLVEKEQLKPEVMRWFR